MRRLDPESVIRGYWSDGSVDLDLLKVARSADVEIVQPGQKLVLVCVGEFEGSATCVDPGSFNLPAGALVSMEPVYIRVPAGEYSIGFVPPIASSVETVVEVPARITGVDRTVWACVMDDSNVGQFREGDEGRGCAAWTEDFVVKWDGSKPVRVWTSGEPSWVAEFERTLAYVADLAGLELETARNADEADFIARIGVPRIEGGEDGESCPGGAAGCANAKIRDGNRIYHVRTAIHYGDDEPPMEFDQMEEFDQLKLRQVMLHELVHALSWMQHRTETGSAMESGVSPRVGLSPMDEALLRLQGHPLVEPGMTLPELENLIIFSDELIDDSVNIRFDSWRMVKDTYDMLRAQGSAELAVTASSQGCAPQFGPALYQVGNITRRSGGYAWVRTSSRDGSLITMDRTTEPQEYWSEYLGVWRLISEQDHLEAAPGWRSDLADLHAILETAFYFGDWDSANIYPIGDGFVAVRLDINIVPAPGNRRVGGALTLVIDELTGDLSEYDMSWRLSNDECDSYRVQATAVSFGRPFELPDAVRGRSAIIASCHLDLGQLEGAVSTGKSWERFCEPDRRSGVRDAFAATFGFSLSDWAIVRAEVESSSMNRLQLMGAPPGPEAVIDDRIGSPRWDGWVQKLLPPGSYSLQVSTDEVPVPGGFRIAVNGSKVAPPPHRARAIFAEGRHTCALLMDGSPVCWGWNLHGQAAPPEGEKFTQFAMTIVATCGLRSDGSVVCWGSEESEVIVNMPPGNELFEYITGGFGFVCGLREDGTVLCWGANGQGQLDVPQGAVFAAVAAGPSHVCGLRPDGSPTCWGLNIHAQSDVPKNARFVSISAGDRHSCGLRADGSVDCWGSGGSAQCAVKPDGSTSCRYDAEDSAPAPPDGVVLTSFSLGQPFCGLTSDGEPICWGRDERGQASPPKGERFTALSASGTHTCGLREDGTISCWGWDQFGQASPPLAGH